MSCFHSLLSCGRRYTQTTSRFSFSQRSLPHLRCKIDRRMSTLHEFFKSEDIMAAYKTGERMAIFSAEQLVSLVAQQTIQHAKVTLLRRLKSPVFGVLSYRALP